MTTSAQDRDARTAMTLKTVEGAFEKLLAQPASTAPAWLQPLQKKAFGAFRTTGFPRTRDEDWKYTNLTGFAERSATYLRNQPTNEGNSEAAGAINTLLDDLPRTNGGIRIVFINGLYRRDLSITAEMNPGVELTPYSAVDAATGERILRDQPIDQNAMIALNTAFLNDGLAIQVADDKKIDAPIHIVFASDGQPAAVQPRLSIDIGHNADATIVQHHVGIGESLTNAVTSIHCAKHAHLFFIRLQDESPASMHVGNQLVRVAANGRFDSISMDFGSQLARNDLKVDLYGERAQANLYGLFMANGKRHTDNHLRVDHRAPHTTSLENYRGILNDTARGVFNGKIIVHSGADGTDAQMNNRNLLLSEQAEVDTKPELEIYTDDVKCAHGSTTGQLDRNSLFYLRARGLPEITARMMLVNAFAQEIIDHVRLKAPDLADTLDRLLGKQLPGNA